VYKRQDMMIEGIGRKDDRIISILRIKALLKNGN
jgi:chemotaxis signal transduction protein